MRHLFVLLSILALVTLASGGSATAAPAPVAGMIRVDTLEQEVHPFKDRNLTWQS